MGEELHDWAWGAAGLGIRIMCELYIYLHGSAVAQRNTSARCLGGNTAACATAAPLHKGKGKGLVFLSLHATAGSHLQGRGHTEL